MRGKINVDAETVKYLYKQYKDFILSFFVIFVSLILVLVSVIPQIKELGNIFGQRETELKKLEILKKNFELLSNLDTGVLDAQFETISSALPQNKDFEGIIYAVERAAQRAGVLLDDFEFQVGDLTNVTATSEEFPNLSIKLNIQASNQQQVANFITELSKSVPLAEVLDVSVSDRSTKLSAVFYYKPFPKVELDSYIPLRKLSSEKKQLINELSLWKSHSAVNFQFPVSSRSGQIFSPF